MTWTDATAMAQAVRQKAVSPLELVEEAIAKIERLNPSLNAVVYKQYEEARQLAQEGCFDVQPFAGVPLLLKDLGQEQAGAVSTAGSALFAGYRPQQTDHYVAALERLGFIILGRTNTPEFGFKNISDSRFHGPVSLPQDLTRNAGGSSGGAAAAAASGMVPLAAASDGGGSIRIPASFNGLIGLKPSRGRIPVGPGSYRGWQGAAVNFALTKSVRDTRRLLYHLQTCQMESPFPLPLLSRESLFDFRAEQPLRIAFSSRSPIGSSVSQTAQAAVHKAAVFLAELGHEVTDLAQEPLDGIEAMKSYYLMNSVETAAMFDGIEASLGRSMRLEDMELMSWVLYQSGQKILAKDFTKILQDWDQYSAQMAVFHETYDLYLTPATAEAAPKQDQFPLSAALQEQLRHIADYSQSEQQELIWQMFEESLAWTPFTQQANLTGQPSISLPLHRTAEGLPLGVQLTAAKGREDLLLYVAQLFEEAGKFER
ncbi:amidase [Streptococcus panodentis]|uniref:Amidase n=1 Tax=Streptococcus panodentis TaxID=1581472 RepID=A0ABS5AZG2_9STRE|nr:amidase [Streptococcus panodentis]MBP2621961.1 amidase [Streptococcus panodentis]